jgi:hypothetical protein
VIFMTEAMIIRKALQSFPEQTIIKAANLYEEKFRETVNELNYYKVLERLVEQQELAKLTNGLFYIPKKTKYGLLPMSDELIVSSLIGKNTEGMEIGYGLYNKLGLSTQIPKSRVFLSNKMDNFQRTIHQLRFYRHDLLFTPQAKSMIEFLEVLQNFKNIQDINLSIFQKFVLSSVQHYDDQTLKIILSVRKYKKSTLAFLHELLQAFQVKNDVNQLLSPLSKYQIPDWKTSNESSSK